MVTPPPEMAVPGDRKGARCANTNRDDESFLVG